MHGHRAAISLVLSLSAYNPSEDDILRRLMTRFARERPCQVRVVPDWDLSLVLAQFMKPPFRAGLSTVELGYPSPAFTLQDLLLVGFGLGCSALGTTCLGAYVSLVSYHS